MYVNESFSLSTCVLIQLFYPNIHHCTMMILGPDQPDHFLATGNFNNTLMEQSVKHIATMHSTYTALSNI